MCWARASLVRHNRSCTPENPAKPPPSRTRGPRCVFAARVETRAVPQASGGVTCVFACPARLQRRHSRQRRSRLRHSSGCPTEMPDGNGQVCRHPPPGAVCRRVGGSFHCCHEHLPPHHASSAAPTATVRVAAVGAKGLRTLLRGQQQPSVELSPRSLHRPWVRKRGTSPSEVSRPRRGNRTGSRTWTVTRA